MRASWPPGIVVLRVKTKKGRKLYTSLWIGRWELEIVTGTPFQRGTELKGMRLSDTFLGVTQILSRSDHQELALSFLIDDSVMER